MKTYLHKLRQSKTQSSFNKKFKRERDSQPDRKHSPNHLMNNNQAHSLQKRNHPNCVNIGSQQMYGESLGFSQYSHSSQMYPIMEPEQYVNYYNQYSTPQSVLHHSHTAAIPSYPNNFYNYSQAYNQQSEIVPSQGPQKLSKNEQLSKALLFLKGKFELINKSFNFSIQEDEFKRKIDGIQVLPFKRWDFLQKNSFKE